MISNSLVIGKFFNKLGDSKNVLVPNKGDVKKLFQSHQNQCAFLSCNRRIIDSDNHINGNIYFIESNIKGSPRYNPKLTDNEMIEYQNLILLCDVHGWEIEWREKNFPASRLRKEIFYDKQILQEQNYEISEEMYENFISHFLDYYDPDRFSHIKIKSIEYRPKSWGGPENVDIHDNSVYVKPTRHFPGGKFEIIDTKMRIQEGDEVIFYPKNSKDKSGFQAEIKIKGNMRIVGKVPKLSKGEYLISIHSLSKLNIDEKVNLEFTVM